METENFKCTICGAEENLSEYDTNSTLYDIMSNRHLCFKCAFWTYHLEHRTFYTFIINGQHFVGHKVDKTQNNSSFSLGHGSHDFYIRFLQDGRIRHYNNVWHQGDVPDWPEFKDNAEYVTKKEFEDYCKDLTVSDIIEAPEFLDCLAQVLKRDDNYKMRRKLNISYCYSDILDFKILYKRVLQKALDSNEFPSTIRSYIKRIGDLAVHSTWNYIAKFGGPETIMYKKEG